MPLPDEVRIRHIRDAAGDAVKFVEGKSRADLDSNEMLSLALVRLLEVIGEAANGISPELRAKHPAVHWAVSHYGVSRFTLERNTVQCFGGTILH